MIVYIAGKYRGKTIRETQQNIEKASDVAYKYWCLGYVVICPHKNTSLFDDGDDDKYLNGDLEILKRCDAIVMIKDWEDSSGAKKELEVAKENDLNIIFDILI